MLSINEICNGQRNVTFYQFRKIRNAQKLKKKMSLKFPNKLKKPQQSLPL